MKKTVSVILLAFLLTSMFSLAFNVQPAKADETIYIRADGSIDTPVDAPMEQSGNTFIFTEDINYSIVVEESGIIIDGNGHKLIGPGVAVYSYGIDLSNADMVTIKNVNIMNWTVGVWMYGTWPDTHIPVGNTVMNCIIHDCFDGVDIVITDPTWGIHCHNITYNTIAHNIEVGIMMSGVFNKVHHNNFIENGLQAYCEATGTAWDIGYYGGNYWSDYTGSDANGDGIGDTPYVIDSYDQDNYPLMTPFILGDVTGNLEVDIFDLITVAHVFGTTQSDTRWNYRCDLDQNGVVDIYDLRILATNFGRQWKSP